MKEYLFVILLIVGIVVLVAIGDAYQPPEKNPYSSESRELEGSLALYLLLDKYTTVERLRTPFGDLNPGTLIMINPVSVPSSEEIKYVYEWINEGNRLVVFSDDPSVMQAFGATLASHNTTWAIIPSSKAHWSTRDVTSIEVIYHRSFRMHAGEVLFADGDNPIVVEAKRGEGEMILVTTPSLTSNINIDSKDNEIFLVRVSLSERVYFDEYHGRLIQKGKGLVAELKTMFSSEHVPFLVQLTVACALFLMAHGKRFGGSRPETPREVQSSELVLSAADLYYKAGKKEILEVVEKENSNDQSARKRGELHVQRSS